MTTNVFYERFNEQAYTFMKELAETFPQINEFNRFKSALNVLRNVNIKTPQSFFNTYILSTYRDMLLKKDETFFLQEEKFGIRDEYWFDFINQLKYMWKTLEQDNKDVIWKYFHVLILLSDKCNVFV
jgi:hypothetical protein